MKTYLALLRGVNVGGKALIKMADLRAALPSSLFHNPATYIQSGNLLFESAASPQTLKQSLQTTLQHNYKLSVDVAIFTAADWRALMAAAPAWWGKSTEQKHNLFILTGPQTAKDVLAAAVELKPDMEVMAAGKKALYQSMSNTLVGRTTTSKLASSPLYKQLTIRNYNTAHKLLALLTARQA